MTIGLNELKEIGLKLKNIESEKILHTIIDGIKNNVKNIESQNEFIEAIFALKDNPNNYINLSKDLKNNDKVIEFVLDKDLQVTKCFSEENFLKPFVIKKILQDKNLYLEMIKKIVNEKEYEVLKEIISDEELKENYFNIILFNIDNIGLKEINESILFNLVKDDVSYMKDDKNNEKF